MHAIRARALYAEPKLRRYVVPPQRQVIPADQLLGVSKQGLQTRHANASKITVYIQKIPAGFAVAIELSVSRLSGTCASMGSLMLVVMSMYPLRGHNPVTAWNSAGRG